MISSRATGKLHGTNDDLGAIRQRLIRELAGDLFGQPLFEIWLNELYHGATGADRIAARCREEVRSADVVLVLFNGQAGWSASDAIGICHTEFAEAMYSNSQKVRLVDLPLNPRARKRAERERDEAFREAVKASSVFHVASATTADEVVAACKEALLYTVVELAHSGSRSGRVSAVADSGAALDWTRMNFQQRATAMIGAMRTALRRAGARPLPRQRRSSSHGALLERLLIHKLDQTTDVLIQCHAIPAAMGVAAAREMVGQPFLLDHRLADLLSPDVAGPIHLIACSRNVTESQAIRQLGFPDATIVASTFGVYVADPIQRVQLVFLSNCRNDDMTAAQVEEFLEWIGRTREAAALCVRAVDRAKLVRLMAEGLV